MNWMRGNAENYREKKRKERSRQFFFERGTSMHETNARAQRNNRKLHLGLVGNKVTYVRVY